MQQAVSAVAPCEALGFSEIVYPGASHTRFTHSLGVFHTARDLMSIVRERSQGERSETRENTALAAALVHDLGHGPFSHSFETVGKELGLKLADHELVSDLLIRNGEIAEIFKKEMGSGFANDVADMIKKEGQQTVHNAVVSSQFDADRLDYMRRDRLMTGSQHSAIDFTWLLANLEIADVPIGIDDEQVGTVPTFVIGPKAIHAAEAYVMGLFQLYPTVYFHKATRGAEKIFVQLLVRLVQLVRDGSLERVGLPANHPLIKFARSPDDIESVLNLDDTVVWGVLSQLQDSNDDLLKSFAARLQNRNLFKCFDVRTTVHHKIDPTNRGKPDFVEQIDKCCAKIFNGLRELKNNESAEDGIPKLLLDEGRRSPYKTSGGTNGPVEQINVRTEGGALIDLKQRSEVVAGLRDFKLNRVYCDRDDTATLENIEAVVQKELNACQI